MNPLIYLTIIPIIGLIKSSYAFGTTFEKNLIVKDKYIKRIDGIQRHIIVDSNNNIYIIGKSLWYLTFNNEERWYKININDNYKVNGYGRSLPFLHIYPNLINVKKN